MPNQVSVPRSTHRVSHTSTQSSRALDEERVLDRYFNQLNPSNAETMPRLRMIALAEIIQAGRSLGRDGAIKLSKAATEARNTLAEGHLRLVIPIAKKFRGAVTQSFRMPDIIQAGNLALLDAAARFDHTRGHAFSTFAYYRIKGGILDAIRSNSTTVHLPKEIWRLLKESDALQNRYYSCHGKEMTEYQLAKSLEHKRTKSRGTILADPSNPRKLVELVQLANELVEIDRTFRARATSLQRSEVDQLTGTLPDPDSLEAPTPSPESIAMQRISNQRWLIRIAKLSPQQQVVLRGLAGLTADGESVEPKSLREVSSELGLKYHTFCRIKDYAIEKLAILYPKG